MGLDIYLYKYETYAEYDNLSTDHDLMSEKAWDLGGKKYEQLTQKEKDSASKSVEKWEISHGFVKGEYGYEQPGRVKIEENSTIHPEHMFKVGYFRSSYNDGGINPILRNHGLPELAEIWGCEDVYTFRPDWKKAKKNLSAVLKKLNQVIADGLDLRCTEIAPNPFGQTYVKSAAEALEMVKDKLIEHRGREKNDLFGSSFSNLSGQFHLGEPLEVIGMIHGLSSFKNDPCLFVVTKGETKWYAEAIEVMMETCDYVLSHKDEEEQFYLRWSG